MDGPRNLAKQLIWKKRLIVSVNQPLGLTTWCHELKKQTAKKPRQTIHPFSCGLAPYTRAIKGCVFVDIWWITVGTLLNTMFWLLFWDIGEHPAWSIFNR